MAQKVAGYIKLQIPAGKATPAPPVGPALGQHGVNIMQFAKEQRHHRLQFLSRRLVRSKAAQVFLTRQR